jgi:hypothetical protein
VRVDHVVADLEGDVLDLRGDLDVLVVLFFDDFGNGALLLQAVSSPAASSAV